MAFFEMGKYYVTHACGKTDEAAVEKSMNQYRDDKLIYDEAKLTGEAYKYNFGDMAGDAEVTARYHYSVADKYYWVKTDAKGGRKYVKESDLA